MEALAAIGDPWSIGFTASTFVSSDVCLPWVSPNCGLIGRHVAEFNIYCYSYNGPSQFISLSLKYLTDLFGIPPVAQAVLDGLGVILPTNPTLCFPTLWDMNLGDLNIVKTTGMVLYDYYNDPGFMEQQYPIFPLLHEVLHGDEGGLKIPRTGQFGGQFYANILNSAPCKLPNQKFGPTGWRGGDRWNKFYEARDGGPNDVDYPGLDYMLLYNLNRIRFDNRRYPSEPLLNLSLNNKTLNGGITERAFLDFTASNTTVKSGSTVNFYANNLISLDKEFQVEQNADFVAEIREEYNCNQSQGYFRKGEEEQVKTKSESPAKVLNNNKFKKYQSVEDYLNKSKSSPENNGLYLKSTIVPNPATNLITIDIQKNFTSIAKISMYDSQGKLINILGEVVLNDVYQLTYAFDISSLNPGLYIVNIETTEKKSTQKFIKE